MEQELNLVKFKKNLKVEIGDSTLEFVYDTLTDIIVVTCNGK